MRLAMSHGLAKTFRILTISSQLGCFINRFRASSKLLNSHLKCLVPYQVILEKSQVFRVPLECTEVHVLSGIAWLTVEGEDIILNSGEKVSLASNKGLVILSVLGNVPLILEVL